jgi:hypothetical protein
LNHEDCWAGVGGLGRGREAREKNLMPSLSIYYEQDLTRDQGMFCRCVFLLARGSLRMKRNERVFSRDVLGEPNVLPVLPGTS